MYTLFSISFKLCKNNSSQYARFPRFVWSLPCFRFYLFFENDLIHNITNKKPVSTCIAKNEKAPDCVDSNAANGIS